MPKWGGVIVIVYFGYSKLKDGRADARPGSGVHI